jgi:gamma-glutamyltranspeptidase/glutathione hydrolase
VNPERASATGAGAATEAQRGDTIVLSTADRWGNMVSWVNSNYDAFGSGLTVPGYGFVLHSRGALFTLDPKSPNVIASHKRPFNTLSAGMVMRDDRPLMTVTLMGGFMQAQGIAQTLLNVLDLGANVQAASDMARFSHSNLSNTLGLESLLYELVGPQLGAMGHKVQRVPSAVVGGFQAILLEAALIPRADKAPPPTAAAALEGPAGVYRGGSDHRKDGQAVGY